MLYINYLKLLHTISHIYEYFFCVYDNQKHRNSEHIDNELRNQAVSVLYLQIKTYIIYQTQLSSILLQNVYAY